ncbi:MAG: hypothetical protein JPMHGGIA_00702 [Saprospiraceae bacterium]|jgi:hypothetical protein|nr:hypothetical protein [Saprospiraceae bacterium]
MYNQLSFLFCMLLALSTGCKNEKPGNGTNTAVAGKAIELDAMDANHISKLRSEGTSVDLISLKKDVNVSMSFDNPQAFSIIMSFITSEKGLLTTSCLPDAHLIVQKSGDILQEMDLYYKNGCNAMVFLDGEGKKIAANSISNEGVDFFNNFLKTKSSQDSLGR